MFWHVMNFFGNTNVNKKILTCKVKRVEIKYTAIVNSCNCSLHTNGKEKKNFFLIYKN